MTMDTDALQRTLDAIDAALVDVCGWCHAPLPNNGASLDYCTEAHQELWLARHTSAVLRHELLVDNGPLSDNLIEARDIWTDDRLDALHCTAPLRRIAVPARLRDVLNELNQYVWTERPLLFDTPLRYDLADFDLQWNLPQRLHEPRSILRDINIA
jgi:hypothetical protein